MLENIFVNVIEISIGASIIIALLTIASPLIKKVYAAKWRYIIWLILSIRLVIPFNLTVSSPAVNISIPTDMDVFNSTEGFVNGFANSILPVQIKDQQMQDDVYSKTVYSYNFLEILSFIWLFGILIFVFRPFIAYILFKKKMKRWTKPVTNDGIMSLFNSLCCEMNIRKKPKIRWNNSICSPMMYGFLNTVLFLPGNDYEDYDLEVILRHELTHYKRHDLWYKLILLTANAVHWFNPFVYLMTKSAYDDIEFSCDDEVIKNSDIVFKKRYSMAILNSMNKEHIQSIALSTQFRGGKRAMKMRFSNILTTAKKRKGITALCAFIVLILICGLFAAYNKENKNNTENQSAGDEKQISTLKIEAGEGGTILTELENGINGDYEEGAIISIMAGEIEGYYFTNWSSSNGGLFSDKNNLQTTFSMPGNDTVITANFKLQNEATVDEAGIIYINEWLGFSARFPSDWADRFEIIENYVEYDSRGGAGITVYQKVQEDSEISNRTRILCYIERWIGAWTEEEPPIYGSHSTIVLQTDQYTYMLRTPSNVEYNKNDEETGKEYNTMLSQLSTVMASVKGINTLASIPNAGYQTEAEFLGSPDGIKIRTVAYGAAMAMLSADADELSTYLIEPENASKRVRGIANVSDSLVLLKFSFNLECIISDDEIRPSYQYLLMGDDSYSYVSMTLTKLDGEWKVISIGIEK